MKNILYILNYKGSIGGISGQAKLLANKVATEGYNVQIFSTHGNPIKRCVFFFKLLWVSRKFDILHVHGCSDWGFLPVVYGIIAGKVWCKRIIVTYHGGDADHFFGRYPAFVKRWLNRADAVIVLSGFLQSVFNKYGIKNVVIPNIIELQEIKHIDFNKECIRFLSNRHLQELYNIPCILRAYEIVKQQYKQCSLTILGQGPLRTQLEQWVADQKLRDVAFVGQVPNEEMNRYLSESDVMLSAPHIDNMPVSVLEAMNAGVLVISSRVGGVPYIIEENKTGLLFADDNAEELADKMLWAIEHLEERAEIVAAAKKDVQKYEWRNIRSQILKLYE